MAGGDGPLALLIHGTAGSWRNFRPWLPALQPRCSCLIPDLPGFGSSPPPEIEPGLSAWAEILHELIQELGRPLRVIVGLGLGASLALTYLRRDLAAPEGLAAVILHTPPYHPGAFRRPVRWAIRTLASRGIFALTQGILGHPRVTDWYVRSFVRAPGTPPEETTALQEDFRRASLPVLRGLTADAMRADFRPLLHEIRAPTLAIVSEHDPFVYPAEIERLSTLMRDVRVVVQKEIAHGWTAAAVAQQNEIIAGFLDRHLPHGFKLSP
jgi:pimeloyl-ACP methyl ester carboxylesterase